MVVPPEQFARIAGHVDFPLLQDKRVVIVGVGAVGSPIAAYLANSTVGFLRLIDPDILDIENPYRHALPVEYLGCNKAEALADYLSKQVEGLHVESVTRKIDQTVPGELLERWLADADLIVAATDDREAQRRVGAFALALGIPAIFPGQYVEGGGEVIVQLDSELPCFGCWDYFRDDDEQLRGVTGLPFAELPVIYTSMRLCLGILDPNSEDREMMVEPAGPPFQVFALNRSGQLDRAPLERRENCPACGGGPELSSRPTPQSFSPAPTDTFSAVSVNLAQFMLVVLVTIAPSAILAALVAAGGLNHPDFGVAVIRDVCTIGCLVGLVATPVAFLRLSAWAQGIVLTLCLSLLIGGHLLFA